MEIENIKKFNTIIPNGYNISECGDLHIKTNNIVQKEKIDINGTLSNKKLGIKMSDLSKLYLAISRIEKFNDSDLPSYIKKLKLKHKDKYMIKYPIIENNVMTFVTKEFDQLELAKSEIIELEKLHDSTNKINQINKDRISIPKNKNEDDLPKFITPIQNKGYILGYKVSNYTYSNGAIAEQRDFTNATTNTRNLHNAKVYLEYLERMNKNISFEIPMLPPGFFHFKEKNRVGTHVEGFKIRNGYRLNTNPNICKNKIPTYKKFCDMTLTLEDNYNIANTYYNTL